MIDIAKLKNAAESVIHLTTEWERVAYGHIQGDTELLATDWAQARIELANEAYTILSLISRLERAEAALKPFADVYIPHLAPEGATHEIAINTFYEYRAAREALEASK